MCVWGSLVLFSLLLQDTACHCGLSLEVFFMACFGLWVFWSCTFMQKHISVYERNQRNTQSSVMSKPQFLLCQMDTKNLTVILCLCTLGKAWDKPSTQKCFIFTRWASNYKLQLEPGKKKGARFWSLAASLCTCPHTWTVRHDSGRFHGHPVLLFPKTMRRLVCKERSCRTTDFFLSLSCGCALLLLRLQKSTVTLVDAGFQRCTTNWSLLLMTSHPGFIVWYESSSKNVGKYFPQFFIWPPCPL